MTNSTIKQLLITKNKNSLKEGVNRKIYAFKDEAVGFTEIFNQPNDAIAVRLFTDLTNKENSHFNKYADCMSLWCLGEYNDITGVITNTTTRLIIKGEQCKIEKQ